MGKGLSGATISIKLSDESNLVSNENTIIGNNCYIMAYNHIAHDSVICNHVIMANNIQMGGYSIIHDYANIGLSSAIHQRSTIEAYAM